MVFKAIVRPAEEGGFWGEVPALPGCVSQGETQEELLEHLKEAAIGWLEASQDEGCLLYTSPSPRDRSLSRMPSSA